ncbi:MAG TPA: AraC family transcriptional regulator [Bacteroidales bacterium]|nr:AraC family transcriptional regulator [Bacteroidales bacterium]
MKILVKNMVSARCIIAVRTALEQLDIPYESLELGEVEVKGKVSDDKVRMLDNLLRPLGLEIKEDKKFILVEKIKAAIVDLVHNSDEQAKVTLSDYLSQKLNYNCTYLSNLFSEVTGISIEKYFITKKIEHVKDLLVNENLNLKEISFITRYSSVAHLSYQFKKITGVAPSEFRTMINKGHTASLQEAAY